MSEETDKLQAALAVVGEVWPRGWTRARLGAYMGVLDGLEVHDVEAGVRRVVSSWDQTETPPPGVFRAAALTARTAREEDERWAREHGGLTPQEALRLQRARAMDGLRPRSAPELRGKELVRG
jgi:mannose/cellobiose epimerase-like protein (N-acyl-D-glucosamine 2-epimerase family)